MIVALDSGPLGLVTNPAANPVARDCAAWLTTVLSAGHEVVIPEICDYEIRRELVRAGKAPGLLRLNQLESSLRYVPITTTAMRLACDLWAQVRNAGMPTASDKSLDGDMILAAQVAELGTSSVAAIVATGNVKHLSLVCTAFDWHDRSWI